MIQNQPQTAQTANGARLHLHDETTILICKKPGNLLRLPRVMQLSALGKSSIYAGVKAGTFPAPVRLSARAVGWREEDLDKWVSERISTVAK